jgi:hypothetical protein
MVSLERESPGKENLGRVFRWRDLGEKQSREIETSKDDSLNCHSDTHNRTLADGTQR